MKKKMKTKIFSRNAINNTLISKERFNVFQVGHGILKSSKYPNRNKQKNELKKIIIESRG